LKIAAPRPSLPRRFSTGTRQSSKSNSAIGDVVEAHLLDGPRNAQPRGIPLHEDAGHILEVVATLVEDTAAVIAGAFLVIVHCVQDQHRLFLARTSEEPTGTIAPPRLSDERTIKSTRRDFLQIAEYRSISHQQTMQQRQRALGWCAVVVSG
jgi:hypothetical protein